MENVARRTVLPRFTLTETTANPEEATQTIFLPNGDHYFIREKCEPDSGTRIDGKPRWVQSTFDRFPLVIKGNGEPWYEANIWIMKRLEGKPQPDMETFVGMAYDLAVFWRFIEEKNLDWLNFPDFKLHRPTYRYSSHLRRAMMLGEISDTTAKRRMSRVVSFYRGLLRDKLIALANEPWEEGRAYIHMSDGHGETMSIQVLTTDVAIKTPRAIDPCDDTIEDGGKLRPLPPEEQKWLLDALTFRRHPETLLTHLFALATGARIQTVLTTRLRHFIQEYEGDKPVRLLAGPGTGIDTKGGKRMTLLVPAWLYRALRVYALSDRATKRRRKASGGDTLNQYLFLSPRGAPLYVHKMDEHYGERMVRHAKKGGTLRMYMKKYVISFIRKKYSPTFSYRFHDLRATFGMNLVDASAEAMNRGDVTYTQVLQMVAGRLCHSSMVVTERYLKYRSRINIAHDAQGEWEANLEEITRKALETLQ